MLYLVIFGLEFQKTVVICQISTFKFVKTESLTHTVNFGIGTTFFKGPGSPFSGGPGTGTGLLYKVCPFLQEMLINIKTCHFHSCINYQEHLFHITFYHQLLSSDEYEESFFMNTSRSSRLQMFFKIGVLKSFANFTGKHLCWSLFLKNLKTEGLLLHEKRLQHWCFPVKFANLL